MKCSKCGSNVVAGTRFCGACGSAIHEELANEAASVANTIPDKPLPIKKIAAFGGIAVVAIIAIVICVKLFAPSNYVVSSGDSFFVHMQEDDEKVIVTYSNGTASSFDGQYFSMFNGSLDTGKGAFVIQSINEANDEYLSTLYYVSDNKSKPFADTTSENGAWGTVSANGNAVVFVTDTEYANGYSEGTLSIYNGEKAQTISSSFYPGGSYCVSPDGTAVVYSADFDVKEHEFTTYFWSNGKTTALGDNLYAVAVSNGGKLIYYGDDDKLYVQKGNDKTKLASDNDLGALFFNRDNSSVVYTNNSGKSYISVNGGEKQSLDSTIYNLLLPAGVYQSYGDNYQVNTINVKSFKNTFHLTSSDVYRITEKYESERVAKTSSTAELADDGKTIFYLNSGSVYKIDGLATDRQAEKIIEADVSMFNALGNGSAIYFINYDDELYYQKGKGKPVFIDDDLDSSGFAVYNKEDIVFYISDGELYSTKGGAKASLVNGVDDDDLVAVNAGAFGVIVYGRNYDVAYRSFDGKTFEAMER